MHQGVKEWKQITQHDHLNTTTPNIFQPMSSMFVLSQWHVIDGPSFPLESKKYPQLSDKGKYCGDCVYTVDDVRALIAFANDRGVRVIPELDIPGHSG